ncbi:MAG: tetratricopeptide repeat protein, partial [Proteobacteria bacterium]|nr:tetratricopeptide repeat protein [Pseudomonadota bacterium]
MKAFFIPVLYQRVLKASMWVLLLFFSFVQIGLAEVGQVTLREAEDRGFIRNLFQDEFHDLAEEEAQIYLQRYNEGFFRAEVIFILAQVSVIQKKYSTALKNYDRILKEFPDSSYVEETLFLAGILRIQLGNRQKGEADINRLIKAFPDSKFRSAVHYPMGLVAYHKKSWKRAQSEFLTALGSKQLNSSHRLESQHLLGWIYHFQKKEESAKKSFKHSLTLPLDKKSKAKIAFQLAVYAQNKKDYSTANHWYKRQLKEWALPELDKRSRFWIAENIFQLSQNKTKKP